MASSPPTKKSKKTDNNNNNCCCSWPLKGIVPPLVTPLLDQNVLDLESTRALINHVIDGGVSAIFILGSCGEAPSLLQSTKLEFIKQASTIINKRVPVLVGISDTCYENTIELASTAKNSGAAAVVLTSPYYYPISQIDLKQYVLKVANSIELPIVLYNMPALTKVWFDISTVEELVLECTKIVGIKDSSNGLQYFEKLCKLKTKLLMESNNKRRQDFTVMIGSEQLALKAVRDYSADGVIPGAANFEPKLFVDLYNYAAVSARRSSGTDEDKNDEDEARLSALSKRVDALQAIYKVGGDSGKEKKDTNDEARLSTLSKRVDALQAIYKVGEPTTPYSWLVITKAACYIRNLCKTAKLALPFADITDDHIDQIKSILDGLPPA